MQPQVRRAATRMLAELSPALRQVSPESRTLLFVRIKPSRAQVKLDGFIIPKSKRRTVKGGFLIPVKPGRHEVSARASGYTPQESKRHVSKKGSQSKLILDSSVLDPVLLATPVFVTQKCLSTLNRQVLKSILMVGILGGSRNQAAWTPNLAH